MKETTVIVIIFIILAAIFIIGCSIGYNVGFCNGVAAALETDDFRQDGKDCYISLDNAETWVLYTHEID